jgi:hypothetical protein
MVVTRRNRAEIETLARRLAGCGAEYLLVKYDVRRSFEWNRKLRAEIAPQVEAARRWVSVEDRQPDDPAPAPIPLGLASLKGTVMADGCLYPCCHLCEPRHRIADLRETSLAAVWGSSRHYRVLERSRRGGHACRLFRYGAFLSTPATLKWSPNGAPERRVIFL